MIEELQQVDESVLTSLVELRHERNALRQRLARMQEAATQVSEKVLSRVRSDYEARIAALEDKATPLKEAARGTYGRLLPTLDRAREACETLRLDLEEVELRHKLGEFDDDVHREKAAQASASLRAAEERSSAIADVVTRFQAAFDSPDELAPATTSQIDIPAPASDAAPAVAIAAPGVPHEEEGTLMLPPEPPPAPEPPPPPASSPEPPVWAPLAAWKDSGAENAAPEEPWKAAASLMSELAPPAPTTPTSPTNPALAATAAPAAPADTGPAAELEPEAPTSGFKAEAATALVARLEALDGDLEQRPHYLEPLTFIGRTPENQIRIYKPAVSRRHAQITETDAGWMLRDLSSENGTYVNGQRITERLLADGDRVQFGTSRFVVRLTT